eukprot:3798453-Ditylum_brightwellii.AAC.1
MDDAKGQMNDFHNNHAAPEQLIELLQHDVQLWSDLLLVTLLSRWNTNHEVTMSRTTTRCDIIKLKSKDHD